MRGCVLVVFSQDAPAIDGVPTHPDEGQATDIDGLDLLPQGRKCRFVGMLETARRIGRADKDREPPPRRRRNNLAVLDGGSVCRGGSLRGSGHAHSNTAAT